MSDFSIERILSPQLGHKIPPVMDFAPGGYFQGIPGGYWTLYPGNLSPPAPVPALASVRDPVPVPGCLQYRGMRFVDAYLPYGAAGFHPTDFSNMYPNSGERMRFSSQDSAGILREALETCVYQISVLIQLYVCSFKNKCENKLLDRHLKVQS